MNSVYDARKSCNYLSNFEHVLKGIFHFCYYFPKKRRGLHVIALKLDKELKHFGGVQTITWVSSQYRAFKALLDNCETTILHMEHIASKSDENAEKLRGYLKEFEINRFLVFWHFMTDWVECIKQVSQLF